MANRIPEPNLRRLLVGLNVEGEPLRLAASRHHLVHGRYRRFLRGYRPSHRIRSEDKVVGERHTPSGSGDRGLNMQITEVRVRPANDDLVKAYASICFDHCFLVHDIKVIKGSTSLSISFPTKKLSDGTYRDIAYPANTDTRRMIEQAILADYEKVAAESVNQN